MKSDGERDTVTSERRSSHVIAFVVLSDASVFQAGPLGIRVMCCSVSEDESGLLLRCPHHAAAGWGPKTVLSKNPKASQ